MQKEKFEELFAKIADHSLMKKKIQISKDQFLLGKGWHWF
jgi:hypothetical protein